MTLEELNQLSRESAQEALQQLCAAPKWIELMEQARPFRTVEQMSIQAQSIWHGMGAEQFLAAFEAHPMIGDVNSLKAKFANTQQTASHEQGGTAGASEDTLQALNELNHAYRDKNGFIFIICATGLSADTMLNALQERINNPTQQEIEIAAAEQIKITLLRIQKTFGKPS